jgi:hypothetical protein
MPMQLADADASAYADASADADAVADAIPPRSDEAGTVTCRAVGIQRCALGAGGDAVRVKDLGDAEVAEANARVARLPDAPAQSSVQ